MSIESVKQYEPLFGQWYVRRQLGQGSFGEVYLIEREDALGIRSQSALKFIHISPQLTSSSTMSFGATNGGTFCNEIVEDIINEIKIMESLKGCSNIVSYEDHNVFPLDNDQGWDIIIRMELLTPLEDYFKSKGISEDDTLRLGLDICNALVLCEEHNIIHRDIKPSNIMVSSGGSFKLGDFGIARTVERGTRGGFSRKGTYPYMAPEIYNGASFSDSVDLYSLGIVMYQLLNKGRIPFMPPHPEPIHPADEESAMYRRLKGETMPPPASGNPELQSVVLKACAFKQSDRYSSASQMKRELERIELHPQTALIRFLGAENTVISSKEYRLGEPIEIPPVQDYEAEGYRYSFKGWNPKPTDHADRDAEYTAVWTKKRVGPVVIPKWIPIAGTCAVLAIVAGLVIPRTIGGGGGSTGSSHPTSAPTSAVVTDQPGSETKKPQETTEKTEALTPLELVFPDEWSNELPTDVQGDGYAIECREVYFSSEIQTLKTEPSENYVILESKEVPEGAWTVKSANTVITPEMEEKTVPIWSKMPDAWITVDANQVPSNTATRKVETRPVPGTTDVSDWMPVQGSVPAETETMKVRTRQGESYWKSLPQIKVTSLPNKTDTYDYDIVVTVESGNYVQYVINPREKVGGQLEYQTTTYIPSNKVEYRESTVTGNQTYYRTKAYTEYKCYDDSDWTDHGNQFIKLSEDEYVVKMQMQYRYVQVDGLWPEDPSMEHFALSDRDYTLHYRDADDNKWYGANKSKALQTVNELSVFYPDEMMNIYPEDPVTIGELIRAAVIIRREYLGYTGLLCENDGSNQLYLDYAEKTGLFETDEYSDLGKNAQRQEMAYILGKALPESCLEEIHSIDSVSDVDRNSKYYDSALRLLRAGVISFKENDKIKADQTAPRAEAAALIEKLVHVDSRSK